eukprot:6522479-Alexandrium_andersonii.AAC.1
MCIRDRQMHARLRPPHVARCKPSSLHTWSLSMHRRSWPVAESARIATGRKLRSQRRLSPRHAAHPVSRA